MHSLDTYKHLDTLRVSMHLRCIHHGVVQKNITVLLTWYPTRETQESCLSRFYHFETLSGVIDQSMFPFRALPNPLIIMIPCPSPSIIGYYRVYLGVYLGVRDPQGEWLVACSLRNVWISGLLLSRISDLLLRTSGETWSKRSDPKGLF
jgi:hypothetical protein